MGGKQIWVSPMKITDLTVTLFEWDGIPQMNSGKHTGNFGGSSQLGLVEIKTNEGLSGYSFLGSSSKGAHLDAQSLIEGVKPLLIDQDPTDRERIFDQMIRLQRNSGYRIVGAVDVALWDLMGKIAGLPIHRLLGSYRTSVPAYASSKRFPTADDYATEAAEFKRQGWLAYKIHPPTEPKLDIEVCEEVRSRVGDDFTLMLDSTWAYDYPTALKVGQAVEELDYLWYEDPLVEDDIHNYVKLKQHLDIPVMATEYSPGGFAAKTEWLVRDATDYLRADVAVTGGITNLMKIAHLAEAFHTNFEVHHGGNSLNNVANLHVIMAIQNCGYFEVLLPPAAQKYGLVEDIEVDSNGMVHAFEEPGLGAQIDFDLIEHHKLAVLS
jgi:L-alanine-DL-glutamate epimerase-like enolase superfamily enzyme